MSAGQWRVCQALTVALLVTSVFAVPGAAQTSDGPGGGTGDGYGTHDGTGTSDATSGDGTNGGSGDGSGTSDETGRYGTDGGSGTGDGCCGTGTGAGTGTDAGAEAGESARAPTLSVLPDTGPPGAQVTVSGDGYRACFSPYDDVAPGAVAISWDGSSVATVDVDDATVSAVLPVPDDAPPGAATVTATCLGDSDLTASAQFTVTAPGGTTDPAQTSDGTAQATDAGTPATDPDAEAVDAEAESPAPTAGDAPPADPTPDPADPQPMDATEAVSRTKAGAPVALLAALLVVLAAAAALLSLAVRARWGPAWAVAHVSAVPGTAARGALAVTPSAPGSPAATVVRLEPRPGTVTHVVEEVDR